MKITTALLPALSGLAVAQSTVSLLLFGVDRDQHHDASIVTSDATATTYSLTCPTSVTSYDCDVFRGITAVADSEDGSYTWWGNAKNGYATWACGPSGTEEGVCRKTSDGTDVGLTVYFTNYLSITLTDGSATATASSGQSQGTSTSSSASEGASGSESEATPTPTPTPTSGSEEETPTGGVPRATGPAGLILGGAAVALMGAVL